MKTTSKRKRRGGCSRAAICSVPYHKLPLERPNKIPWQQGESITFPDGRIVAVFRSTAGPGLFFRITRPLSGNRESVLKFRLSDEAACALALLIETKLLPPNTKLRRGGDNL